MKSHVTHNIRSLAPRLFNLFRLTLPYTLPTVCIRLCHDIWWVPRLSESWYPPHPTPGALLTRYARLGALHTSRLCPRNDVTLVSPHHRPSQSCTCTCHNADFTRSSGCSLGPPAGLPRSPSAREKGGKKGPSGGCGWAHKCGHASVARAGAYPRLLAHATAGWWVVPYIGFCSRMVRSTGHVVGHATGSISHSQMFSISRMASAPSLRLP